MAILAVNAGSSTLKFSLYPLLGGVVQSSLLSGSIQGLEPGGSPLLDWSFEGQRQSRALPVTQEDHFAQALRCLGELLAANAALPVLQAVAHRVVHGGEHFSASVLVTDEILAQLAQLNSLAPLHQPQNLQGIRLPVAARDVAAHISQGELLHDERHADDNHQRHARRPVPATFVIPHVIAICQSHRAEKLIRDR